MSKKNIRRVLLIVSIGLFLGLLMVKSVEAKTNKYYIKVNKGTNVATVYKTDGNEPYRAFIVS